MILSRGPKRIEWLLVVLTISACSPSTPDNAIDVVSTTSAGQATLCEADETDGDLDIYVRSNNLPDDLVEGFQAESGVEVKIDFFETDQAVPIKLASGAAYDLVISPDYIISRLIDEGWLSQIQRSAVPHAGNIMPPYSDPPFDPGALHSVAYQTGSTGFGVNLSLIEGEFTPTWDYVFDPESAQQLLGRVSLMAESRETMGAALRYLGHSSSTTSEGELAAASRLVEDSLGQISVFQATNARDLVNGDLALAHGRSGDFAREFSTLDDSSGFRFVVPLEGGTVWVESLAIPKAARDVCSAHAFINFLMSPENATTLAEWSYYATPNQAAFRRLPPVIAEDPIIYPQEETLALLERLLYTGTFETRYNETFAATMP